ncbi:MAG: hypothetical protein ACRC6R_01485 [Bacteroidales bacterium]
MSRIELRKRWGIQEYIRLITSLLLIIYMIISRDYYLILFPMIFLLQAIFIIPALKCKSKDGNECCGEYPKKDDIDSVKESVEYEEVK